MLELGPFGTKKFRGIVVIKSIKNPNLFFTYRLAIFSDYSTMYLLFLDQSTVLIVTCKELENEIGKEQHVHQQVSHIERYEVFFEQDADPDRADSDGPE